MDAISTRDTRTKSPISKKAGDSKSAEVELEDDTSCSSVAQLPNEPESKDVESEDSTPFKIPSIPKRVKVVQKKIHPRRANRPPWKQTARKSTSNPPRVPIINLPECSSKPAVQERPRTGKNTARKSTSKPPLVKETEAKRRAQSDGSSSLNEEADQEGTSS